MVVSMLYVGTSKQLFGHDDCEGAGMMTKRADPAERRRELRWFYRGWRPTRLGRMWNGVMAWVSGVGLTPPILLTRFSCRGVGRVG
jgi:hypothetical protein